MVIPIKLNGILASKENLKRWSISEDDFCGFWGETETIEHLFYYCRGAQVFIKILERWLNTVFNLSLHLTITYVLFGQYSDKTDDVSAMVNLDYLVDYLVIQSKT